MIQIRPVSDLKSELPEIEDLVVKGGQNVYLTKNGYGSMVIMSVEKYAGLTDNLEYKLEEPSKENENNNIRYSHEEIVPRVKSRVSTKE